MWNCCRFNDVKLISIIIVIQIVIIIIVIRLCMEELKEAYLSCLGFIHDLWMSESIKVGFLYILMLWLLFLVVMRTKVNLIL